MGAKSQIKGGQRFKQFMLNEGIKLDLFIVFDPSQWGVQLVIRTGPAEFSRKVVTSKVLGGYLLPGYKVTGGHLETNGGEIISTPSEKSFFKYLTIDFIPPGDRQ